MSHDVSHFFTNSYPLRRPKSGNISRHPLSPTESGQRSWGGQTRLTLVQGRTTTTDSGLNPRIHVNNLDVTTLLLVLATAAAVAASILNR
jgi:hypothetical protein